MAKTLSNVKAATRRYLDESNAQDWTDADVLAEVNFAYHLMISKIMEVYEEYYFTTTPYTYSTDGVNQEFAISSNLLKVQRVEINLNPADPNGQAQRATAIKLEELPLRKNNNLINGSSFFNIGYYLVGNQSAQKIGFVPVPPNAATNNISIWGIEAPSDLADDTDPLIIPYPDNFAQIVGKLAAGNLLKKGQQEVQAANDLLNEAAADILNMQTYISERQSDGPKMIMESAWDDINTSSYVY